MILLIVVIILLDALFCGLAAYIPIEEEKPVKRKQIDTDTGEKIHSIKWDLEEKEEPQIIYSKDCNL